MYNNQLSLRFMQLTNAVLALVILAIEKLEHTGPCRNAHLNVLSHQGRKIDHIILWNPFVSKKEPKNNESIPYRTNGSLPETDYKHKNPRNRSSNDDGCGPPMAGKAGGEPALIVDALTIRKI